MLILVFGTIYSVKAQVGSGNITSLTGSESEPLGMFSINATEIIAGAGGYLTTVNAIVDTAKCYC
jgi:hypothetical protein